MRKLVLLASYLFLLPFLIFSFTLYTLVYFSSAPVEKAENATVAYQTVAEPAVDIIHITVSKEARVETLKKFFEYYNSPLYDYSEFIVQKADEYELDWRLIPAIAMQESTLCKKIPKDSHNCWGYGIYGGKITRFSDYGKAIETVSKSLGTTYKSKGLVDPHEIVTRYTPGSDTWANKVTIVMEELQSSM